MEGKGFSKSDKSFGESEMSTQALSDAKSWLDVLHDAEYRGRKDTDGAARYRLASRLGVKENYLYRLQYRAEEMKDVAGEVYRLLKLAYDGLCERNETAADAYRAERLAMGSKQDATINEKPAAAGLGTAAPTDSARQKDH